MLKNSPGLLSLWHATPQSKQEASRLKYRAEFLLQIGIGRKTSRCGHILMMQARYWLDDFSQYDFELMKNTLAKTRRLQALLHLTYGQLLIAKKRQGAFEYLDYGLRLADGLVNSNDYFEMYNRHVSLRSLKFSRQGSLGCNLQELLNEAAVIDKITQRPGTEIMFQPSRFDTLMS